MPTLDPSSAVRATTTRAHVRRIYNWLNHWIVMRAGTPTKHGGTRDGATARRRLYGELGLLNLLELIPSMEN